MLSAYLTLAITVSLANAAPAKDSRQLHWSTCDRAPISSAPDVATPLHTIESLGTYTPFISQASPYCRNAPDGFTVDMVNVLSRHGARSPTASALKKIKASLAKIKNATEILDSSLDFVKNYTTSGFNADQLTDYGRKELYDSGHAMAKRYPSLKSSSFFRSSGENRVVESSQYFIRGFSNGQFILNDTTLALPDVTLSEDAGFNNTLDVSNCYRDNGEDDDNDESDKLESISQSNWLGVFAGPIAKRLNAKLPGANLTGTDALQLMSLCGFDAVNGLTYSTSNWCNVFTSAEWDQNNYYFDVEKYYGHGYGDPYIKAEYSGYVNELIARFTQSAVIEGAATNTTLDGNPTTFPVNKKFYADFSHDSQMISIMTALGLLEEPLLETTPAVNAIRSHVTQVWKLVPFAGRFVLERLRAPDGDHYIRVLINDAVVPLTWKNCGKYGYDGLCKVNAFVAAQSYAQAQPSNFDKLCNGATLLNATVITRY